jgi:exopolysaccharide production protein ExoQ
MRVARQKSPRAWVGGGVLDIFFILSLFFLSGAALRPLAGDMDPFSAEFSHGTFAVQLIGAVIFAISMLLLGWLAARLRMTIELLLITALLALALASAMWSGDPGLSIRRSAALAGTTIFGLTLALSYEPSELSRLLCRFSALFIVFNLGFAVILPGYSFDHQTEGLAFTGSFTNKNDLGHVLGLSIVILAVAGRKCINRLLWLGYIVVGAGFLLATNSVGSIMAVIVALVTVHSIGRNSVATYLLTFSVVAVVVVISWFDLTLVLGAFGRDTTLSDRTLIWPLLVEVGRQTWLLGAGYGTVWSAAVRDFLEAAFYAGSIRNAHNGYLETWLNLGVLGVALVLGLMLLSFSNLVKRQKSADGELFARVAIGILTYMAVANIVSARLVAYNDISWSLLITVFYLSGVLRLRVKKRVWKPLSRKAQVHSLP